MFNKIVVAMLLLSNAYGISIDCPDVIYFALGLHINSKKPAIWNALQNNCCNASGILCSGQRVTEISWFNMGLDGFINNTALPSGLTQLIIHSNFITGNISNEWPSTLQVINIGTNRLTEYIPTAWPSGLQILHLDTNQFFGTIPSTLPQSLEELALEDNQLSGSIPVPLPSGLQRLGLAGNFITGNVPLFPTTLQFLQLGYPGYPGNRLAGTLVVNKPMNLYINDNWITDIVITDISQLTLCDISNNPLLGNSNIAELTMCTQMGLYSSTSLTNTRTTAATSISNKPVTSRLYKSIDGPNSASETQLKTNTTSVSGNFMIVDLTFPLRYIVNTYTILKNLVSIALLFVVVRKTPVHKKPVLQDLTTV